jgi:hypothetical protein
VVGQLESGLRPLLRRELPLDDHLLPLDDRFLPPGCRRLSLEDLLQLYLQGVALLLELGSLLGVAGGDRLDAVPQAVLLVGEPKALHL